MPAAVTSAEVNTRRDLLRFPFAEAISEAATHAPSVSFQTVIYDLFMTSFLSMFKEKVVMRTIFKSPLPIFAVQYQAQKQG
nr:hypothetical protein [Paraburkholderia sp. HD33-4]